MNESSGQYLAQVLALDPRTQGPQIVQLRERWLRDRQAGTAVAAAVAPTAATTSRDEQAARIRALAEAFLQQSRAAAATALQNLPAIDQPDLRRWVERLRQALALHGELAALLDDDELPTKVRRRVAGILVASPQDATTLRAEQLRRTDPGIGRQVARRLQRSYPGIAAAEAEHVHALARIAKSRRLTKAPAAIGGSLILIWVVTRVVITLMRHQG